jgi:DnaJ-class molecular chaperone
MVNVRFECVGPCCFLQAVTLEQLYNGATKKIAMKKTVLCADCHGQGGSNVESCDACQVRALPC